MQVYRIYVGCNVPDNAPLEPGVVEEVGIRRCPFDGCTIQHVTGVWKGEKEKTVVFEHIGPASDLRYNEVLQWAKLLRLELHQESVLVTRAWLSSYQFVEVTRRDTGTA